MRRRTAAAFVTAAATLISASSARSFAQDQDAAASKPANADAIAVLVAAAAADASAGAFSYKVRTEIKQTPHKRPTETIFFAEADVTVSKADGAITGFRAKGRLWAPHSATFEAARDGDKLRALDFDAKTVEEPAWAFDSSAPPEMGSERSRAPLLRNLIVRELVAPRMYAVGPQESIALSGVATFDGTPCDVVVRKIEVPKDPVRKRGAVRQEIRYAIGKADRLVRDVDIRVTSEEGEFTRTEKLTRVVADPPIDAKTFELATPPGFKPGQFASAPADQLGRGSSDAAASTLKVGESVSDFRLSDLAGKEQTLAKSKGKIVVVHFTSAKDRAGSDRTLEEIRKKAGDRVVIVDCLTDVPEADVAALKKKSSSYARCAGAAGLAEAWGAKAPVAFVVGIDRRILAIVPTAAPPAPPADSDPAKAAADQVDKAVKEHLKKPPAAR